MYLKKILLILLLLPFALQLAAQDDIQFIVDGRLTSDDGKTDGATITISMSGKADEVISPPRTGRFLFKLDFNREYRLTFNREGFFQKIIIVSTYVPTEILQKNNRFPPLSFVLNLFKETDIIDNSFTIKPVARVFYNSKIDNFDSEIYLSDDQIKEQIQAAEEANSTLASERKSISRADELEHAALEKSYDKAIADADALYQKNDYDGAISKFREALMLFSDRPYPRDRIAEIQDLILALKMAEETEQNYLAAIQSGDDQFSATQYNGAIAAYQKALQYKAKDKYATERIEESNKLMKEQIGMVQYNELIAKADQAFNAEVFDQAKGLYQQAIGLRPRDSQYARDQITKIDLEVERLAKLKQLNDQYAEAMSKGNTSFSAQAYPDALNSFKLALSLKQNDEAALNRIEATEAAMATLATNQKYTELISKADDLFDKTQFPDARALYSQALALKTTEQYPKDRIAQIDSRMQFDQQFDQLLADANTSFNQKDYPAAKSKYQQVLQLKADHELSQNRLVEIDGILIQLAIEEQYKAAIEMADQAFNAQRLNVAKDNYQKALALKSLEKYPLTQIQKIDEELMRLAELSTQEEQYQAFMQQGISAFDAEKYSDAITAFQSALALKANDTDATARLNECREILANLEARSQYGDLIATADRAFNANELPRAKELYQNALKLIPAETYPQEQIEQIDERLALLAQLDQLIKQADDAFADEQYQSAKPLYQQALSLAPDHEKALRRITEIDDILALQNAEKQYNDLIASADGSFTAKQYQSAKSNYQKASSLKPDENYPKDQILKIDQELAQLAQLDEDYKKAVGEGDRLGSEKNYPDAIQQYQLALTLRPAATYPSEQIERMKQLQADLLKSQQLDRSYLAYISKADSLLLLNDYRNSRANYTDANRLKPEEQYPVQKISEIDALLAEIDRKNEVMAKVTLAYQAALRRGDGALNEKNYAVATDAYNEAHLLKQEEEYPVKQLAEIERLQAFETEQAYKTAIAKADALFRKEELASAKPAYQEALNIKTDDQYAMNQIALIDQKIQQLAEVEADRQKLEAEYAAKIAEADQAFSDGIYVNSKSLYQEALTLKSKEKYPTDQILKIDDILKQQEQLAILDQQYQEALASAKAAFNLDQLPEAISAYKKAGGLKPDEPEPPQRINEIEQLIAQRAEEARLAAEAEAQRIAAENTAKATKARYDETIALGDAALGQKRYAEAQTAYNKALSIFPNEQYPKDKLNEIELLLQQLAQAELERKQKTLEDSIAQANLLAFNSKIKEAEAFIDKQLLEQALGSYRDAIVILPEKESDVQPKIKELEDLMSQIAKLDADYRATILKADKQFNAEAWNEAKADYTLALNLKPQEAYPKKQIEAIDLKLIELELLAERAKAAEKTNASYTEAIQIADENFNKKDYTVAQFYYQKALNIQPQNPHPQQRLAEISRLIDQSLAADQIQAYNDAITKADTEFERKGFTLARFYYNKALEIKSWEKYPQDRISEISRLTNTMLSQREEQDYLNWINIADEAFVNKDFAVARAYYQRALALKKEEPYPSIRLAEIQKELEKQLAQQSEKEYQNAIAEGDKAFGNKNYSVARFYYNKAIGIKSNEKYPKDQLQLIRNAIGGN
ncbi:hypothetical protein [Mangrovibacterium sp.]|uniref:hypothetical protein n=1 Tax=Mangrovibacterium sp. TaxID=1961364 RepID=UPI003568D37C